MYRSCLPVAYNEGLRSTKGYFGLVLSLYGNSVVHDLMQDCKLNKAFRTLAEKARTDSAEGDFIPRGEQLPDKHEGYD